MVAVPTWLLASSIVSGRRNPRDLYDKVTRSAEPVGYVPHIPHTSVSVKEAGFASIRGPVITDNFPDPTVIHVDGISYAFATRDKNKPVDTRAHIQIATSADNTTWTLLDKDALPTQGNWTTGRSTWAPSVARLDNGKFVLYYSDEPKDAPGKHCIGAALSDTVEGPYLPQDKVFACPDLKTKGGAIDPAGFHDAPTGKRYVIYKVDGNSIGHGGLCMNTVAPIVPTPLMLQEVNPGDGVTCIGDPIKLIEQDQDNGPLIEAPAMHRTSDGTYFLFYSANCFTTPHYDVEYATATDLKGPWNKQNTRLLHTGDGPSLVGPGGLEIIQGGTMVVFHGILTIDNSKKFKSAVQKTATSKGVSLQQAARDTPLVRGMYVAKASFVGKTVSLG